MTGNSSWCKRYAVIISHWLIVPADPAGELIGDGQLQGEEGEDGEEEKEEKEEGVSSMRVLGSVRGQLYTVLS